MYSDAMINTNLANWPPISLGGKTHRLRAELRDFEVGHLFRLSAVALVIRTALVARRRFPVPRSCGAGRTPRRGRASIPIRSTTAPRPEGAARSNRAWHAEPS